MRIIIILLVLLLFILQIEVWRQWGRVQELQERVEEQRDNNRDLAARNSALAAEVQDLRSGLDAVEERARAELGLVREGEEFFLVIDPEDLGPEDLDALERLRALQARQINDDAGAAPSAATDADG